MALCRAKATRLPFTGSKHWSKKWLKNQLNRFIRRQKIDVPDDPGRVTLVFTQSRRLPIKGWL